MKLVEGFDSNYRYVLVAARRARQIQNGARPSVEPHSRKPCRIAEDLLPSGQSEMGNPDAWKCGFAGSDRRRSERKGRRRNRRLNLHTRCASASQVCTGLHYEAQSIHVHRLVRLVQCTGGVPRLHGEQMCTRGRCHIGANRWSSRSRYHDVIQVNLHRRDLLGVVFNIRCDGEEQAPSYLHRWSVAGSRRPDYSHFCHHDTRGTS